MTRAGLLAACWIAIGTGLCGCGGGGGSGGSVGAGAGAAQNPGFTKRQVVVEFAQWSCFRLHFTCYDVDVTMDGVAVGPEALGVGDLVLGTGAQVDRTAFDGGGSTEWVLQHHSSITQISQVVGPVDSIDAAASRLVVMGQPIEMLAVAIDAAVFTPPSELRTLTTGELVRVSGHRSRAGKVLATRIERVATPVAARVSGYVHDFDPANRLFGIANLLIDYGGVGALPDGFSAGALVDVVGATESNPRVLRATHVQLHAPFDAAVDTRVAIEGIVDDIRADRTFSMSGLTISGPDFCDLDALATHAVLRISGVVTDVGRVTLDRSPYCLSAFGAYEAGYDHVSRQVEGPIEQIDVANGLMQILGIRIRTTFATTIQIRDEDGIRTTPLTDALVGETAAVDGFIGATEADVLAERIRIVRDADKRLRLVAVPSATHFPIIEIMGRSVRVDPDVTDFQMCAPDTLADYFAAPPEKVVLYVREQDGELFAWGMFSDYGCWDY